MDYEQHFTKSNYIKLMDKLRTKTKSSLTEREITSIITALPNDFDYVCDVRITNKIKTFVNAITCIEELYKTDEKIEIGWKGEGRVLLGNNLTFGLHRKIFYKDNPEPIEQENTVPNFLVENNYVVLVCTNKGDNVYTQVIYLYLPVNVNN